MTRKRRIWLIVAAVFAVLIVLAVIGNVFGPHTTPALTPNQQAAERACMVIADAKADVQGFAVGGRTWVNAVASCVADHS